MIDTHAHLDACADPPDELVSPGARGRRRPDPHRRRRRSTRARPRSSSQTGTTASSRFSGSTRTGGRDDPTLDELRDLLAHPRAVAVGETGLDFFRDYAPHDRQRALFQQQLELAAELGKPVVIHNRAADEDVLAELADFDGTVVLHCFSSPALLEPALERGYYVSFAGNVTYQNAAELRVAATQVPADRILAETDCPYLAPQPLRGRPNEPANVVHTLAALAEARGRGAGRARRADRRERHARVRAPVSVAPKKELGQHFLVDENILGVIGRLAELGADDVVLEIGPGPRRPDALPRRPRRPRPRGRARPLARAAAARGARGAPNVELRFGDALALDLATLDPPPTKLVANLPYNVATPIVVESLDGLPCSSTGR